ncbi:MAG: DUF2934 domain-containing protein [Deltaproteobacteria bacterium]|nr:DUF2934 domain-containing protein [Deltaproteobacteria bacterium]
MAAGLYERPEYTRRPAISAQFRYTHKIAINTKKIFLQEKNMNMHEEIEKAAYDLYEKSGRAGGRDLENWLEAEKAVIAIHAKKELAAPTAKQVKEKAGSPAEKAKKKDLKGELTRP